MRLQCAVAITGLISLAGPGAAYDCDKKYCTKMSSCAEAHYHFTVCGDDDLDRDKDDIPCEVVCGNNAEIYRQRRQVDGIPQPPAVPGTGTAKELGNAGRVPPNPPAGSVSPALSPPASEAFECAGKKRCAEMTSCDEARFYLTKCGVPSLDGDRDGVPCNALCRRP